MMLDLTPEASRVVAANLTDTRSLEGFLKRIATEISARPNTVLTPEFISTLLGAKAKNNTADDEKTIKAKKQISPQEVLDAVAAYFSVKTTALKGPKRDRPIARPRQVVMYLCKTELGMTLEDVGGLLGGRDHTTVMHGAELITKEISTNVHLRDSVEGIKKTLWG
jgi:chromosomal replication initiator protein